MSANQARFRVAAMARVLGVSPSGYYAWRRRPLSARGQADAELRARVQTIHRRSRGTYGAPRIHAELAAGGVAVSRKRVARVMRSAGIAGVSRRRGPRTTRRNTRVRPAPDRVERRFEAAACTSGRPGHRSIKAACVSGGASRRRTCCHTFRATGITAYLSNGGRGSTCSGSPGGRRPKGDRRSSTTRTAGAVSRSFDEVERHRDPIGRLTRARRARGPTVPVCFRRL